MQNNKNIAYKIIALSALVAALTTIGSGIPSMAQEARFDRDELRAIVEETGISVLRLAEDPDEDQAKSLADNVCLSFIAWAFSPDPVDTHFANDVCNVAEES